MINLYILVSEPVCDNYHDIWHKYTTLILAIHMQPSPQQWLNVGSTVEIRNTKRSLSSVTEPHRSRSAPGNKANCLAK